MKRPDLPVTLALLVAPLAAQHEVGGAEDYRPAVAEASDEGAQAMARFSVTDGFRAELFAAEPLLANPVCFAIDLLGRVYVAETFRHHAGVTDIREHMDWLHEDLANRTVEERLAMMQRHEGEAFEAKYAVEHERVRRIEDTDGDGVADRATVFADGFQHPAAGIGAGLLARGDEVWFTCIPDLWRLVDADDDGVAEEREALHTGYGVNISLLGHDLHGLVRGPDGRLYFSIGDRGFHVESEGEVFAHAHTGAVLRCNLDGSGLEVFATGMRNPQELVFDNRGDLFTGDNNSDGGDQARVVWVLPGSDSGWRYSYQYITEPNLRGPWNAELLWRPLFEDQAAYILPPIENLASGPSGLTAYPGSGWGDEWQDTFFLCDFRGNPSISGVHAFRLEPKGAGFALASSERFLWGSLVTDVDFDWNGGLMVSDWVAGWNKTGKGRLYRVVPDEVEDREAIEATAQLVAEGFEGRPGAELGSLLGHPDRRVRLEAQWALAERGAASAEEFVQATRAQGFARYHGIWGLGQIVRGLGNVERSGYPLPVLRSLTTDPDAEVRAQAVRVLGDLGDKASEGLFLSLLKDSEPRVRLFAAEALGRLGSERAVPGLVALLEREGAQDPWLRTAATVALARSRDLQGVMSRAGHGSSAVRRALCVVLRRHRDPRLAGFLNDEDPLVVAEAARGLYDEGIEAAWPTLADLVRATPRAGLSHYTWRRAMHAARTLGGEVRAEAMALCALSENVPAAARGEMLRVLAGWGEPIALDPVTGAWRPQARRGAAMRTRLAQVLAPTVLRDGEQDLVRGWVELAAASGSTELDPLLAQVARDPERPSGARQRALDAVAHAGGLGRETVRALLDDGDGRVRRAAFARVGELETEGALDLLSLALRSGSRAAGQGALEALAGMDEPRAEALLGEELNSLDAGTLDPGLALDLVRASERRPGLSERTAIWKQRDHWDRLLLEGGDPDRGRRVFLEKSETSCLRCHRVGDAGGDAHGGEAGPDLSDVGTRLERGVLLQSILDPNATIAEGFEMWVFGIDGDAPVAGRIQEEDDEWVTVVTREGELIDLEKSTITARQKDLSGMPQDVSKDLSREELRDLVAYLADLK